MTPTFEQANTSFESGNYRAAISQYEAILAHNGFSAPLLFNLGNAYYRDGQFGAAILNFERAQVLAPRDNSIAANLRLAREKAGVPSPILNEVERAARFLSPNMLALDRQHCPDDDLFGHWYWSASFRVSLIAKSSPLWLP